MADSFCLLGARPVATGLTNAPFWLVGLGAKKTNATIAMRTVCYVAQSLPKWAHPPDFRGITSTIRCIDVHSALDR